MEIIAALLLLIVIFYYARRLDQISTVLVQIRDDAREARGVQPQQPKPDDGLEARARVVDAPPPPALHRSPALENYGQLPRRVTK